MDRALGALTALAAALVAALASTSVLAPPVDAAGTVAPAPDQPGPALVGTPVTGTADAARAPALTTGRYVDRLPRRGVRHYVLPRAADGTTLHVAALFVGTGGSVGEGLRLDVGTTAGDAGCGGSGVFRPTEGEVAPLLFTTTSSWTDVPDHPCATAPRLHLTLHPPSDPADAGRRVELRVYEEPPLSAYGLDLLAAPQEPAWTPPAPGRPRPVTAGTTPSNAPVVGDGSHRLTVRPGRTTVLAVPVDWDQTVAAQLDVDLPAGAASAGPRVRIVGPLLGVITLTYDDRPPPDWSAAPAPGGGPFRTGAQSPVVSYAHRDSYDSGVNAAALAGTHYVLVEWPGDPVAADGAEDLPAVLTLRTSGEAGDGLPGYTAVDGVPAPRATSALVDGTLAAPEQDGPRGETGPAPAAEDRDGTDRRRVAGAALAALLVVAAAGVVRRSRRRATRPAGRGRGR